MVELSLSSCSVICPHEQVAICKKGGLNQGDEGMSLTADFF